jgi:hypothetical protein
MKFAHMAGFLKTDASASVTRSGREIVMFDLHVADQDTGDVEVFKMHLEGALLIRDFRHMLTAGRVLDAYAKPTNYPIERRGVVVADTTVFVVTHLRFPDRSGARKAQEADKEAVAA